MLEPQTVLQDRYLIVKQIGQGGMGAVYIATDQRFGSTVAVKETFFADINLRKAFEREARLLNSLRHPALPRVSDHFVEGEGQFLVMEFIGGEDLGEMIEKTSGVFPVKQVLQWADGILDALEYLHSHQPPIVHRDIKPQNLKLMPNGQIVLLDFGLAKGNASQATRATNTGSVFGYSRHYAPLEQIQGSGTDPRSDIYSLAATLYRLLTGIVPPDALSRATAVINGQPDPLIPANEVHAQLNSALAQILLRAMSQNAAQRPASAAELRSMLREAANSALTNEKVTNPLEKGANTILDQDTKLMHGSSLINNHMANVVHTPQTVPMTHNAQNSEQQSLSSSHAPTLNPTIASTPQIISNPNPTHALTVAEQDSVVTKLTPNYYMNRSGLFRYFGVAAGILLLLGVSGLAFHYAFKQNPKNDLDPLQQITTPTEQINANITTGPTTNENQNPKQTTHIKTQPEPRKQQTTSTNKTSNTNPAAPIKPQTPPAQPQSNPTPETNARDRNNQTPDNKPVPQQTDYPNTRQERRQMEMEMRRRFKRRMIEEIRRRQPPNFRP